MKANQQQLGMRGLLLFGVMVLGIYAVIPFGRAVPCVLGSHGVRVAVVGQDHVWTSPNALSHPCASAHTNPPPFKITCGSVDVLASGYMLLCGDPPPDPGTAYATYSYEVSGGLRVKETTNGLGWQQYHVWIENPDEDGKVIITATVSGNTPHHDNNPEYTNWCAAATFAAVGVIEYDADKGCGGGQCSADGGFGTGVIGNKHGPVFELGLGADTAVRSGGAITLSATAPSANLSKPALLVYPDGGSNVEVMTNGGGLKQIKAPGGLVNIEVKDDYEYQLQCFDSSGVGLKVGGFYQTNGLAFATWTVRNPDTNVANNRLWITENRGGVQRLFQYAYTNVDSRWDLVKPDGQTESNWQIPGTGAVTNYFEQVSSAGQVVRKSQKTYQLVTGGAGGAGFKQSLLLQEINGDGALTNTTSYLYYTNGPASNQVQRVLYPDGRWEYFIYDSLARKVTNYSAYNNSPAPTNSSPDPVALGCKVTEYAYSLNTTEDGVDDDGSQRPGMPSRTVVKIPAGGVLREVSRSYNLSDFPVGLEAQSTITEIMIECANPGDGAYAAGNLTTTTYRYNTADYQSGRPSQVYRPDGSYTYYSYPDEFTTVVDESDGTQIETVVDDWGKVVSRKRTDVSGVVLEHQTYQYTDELRQSYTVTDQLSGRVTDYEHGCCTLDSVTDADMAVTLFDYDVLKRQVASQIFYGGTPGPKQTNVLDAVGRVLERRRIGTDGTAVVQEQAQYDVLGRLVRQTNALNGVTVITNVIINSRRCVTNTYADAGTRIETYYRDGRLESVSGTAVSPVNYYYGVEQDGGSGPWHEYTLEVRPDGAGGTNEWTKTYVDALGRTFKTVYADATPGNLGNNPYTQSFYNLKGQLVKVRDPDNIVTLHQYNSAGEREYTVTDMNPDDTWVDGNGDYSIDWASDRITRSVRSVVAATGGAPDLTRVETYVWKDGDYYGTLLSTTDTATSGLTNWHTLYPAAGVVLTSTNVTTVSGSTRTRTAYAADGSSTMSVYSYGRLQSTTRKDANGGQLSQTTMGYDAHGRQNTLTDARTGTDTYAFNAADQVVTVITPNPGLGAQVMTTLYDTSGRTTGIIHPDGTTTTNLYYANGLLGKTWGSRAYPVGYGYDAQGRMRYMTNWQSFATGGGAAITRWNYDAYRGWLKSKDYPDATTGNPPGTEGTGGPVYTYTDGGRLKTRTWQRGVGTTNTYTAAGDLATVTYSDSTPGMVNTYSRQGLLTSAAQAGSTTVSRVYNTAGMMLGEAYTGGPLDGLMVTNLFDEHLRRTNVAIVDAQSTVVAETGYAYDEASRLEKVMSGNAVATYSYLANSPLVEKIAFTNNGSARMTTTKAYDTLNRLKSISSASSAGVASSFAYDYNNANQRTRVGLADGSHWEYTYDALGQVVSGKRYWLDGTPVAGQQFEYGFDDIGNRKTTGAGGDASGWGLRSTSYTANRLNQYTSRTVPDAVDILGIANPTAEVLVNGFAAYRKGEYFRKEFSVTNSIAPAWHALSIVSQYGGKETNTGSILVPKATESFTHDEDGNLTSDSIWTNLWNGENRRIIAEGRSTLPTAARLKEQWTFLPDGRWIERIVSTNNGGYVAAYTNRYVWDGNVLMAVLDHTNGVSLAFVRGLDLSGSLQGAGGVGGLLAVNVYSNAALTATHFSCFDGNGNVAMLVDGADGSESARYETGPFAEPLRMTGPMAKVNPIRFSTQYADDVTGDTKYLYRDYRADTGRWPNSDPIGEPGFELLRGQQPSPLAGGPNRYLFVGNSPLNHVDELGLAYGNPVSGPNGPVGPSDPWSPGGAYWVPPAPRPLSCIESCALQHFLGIRTPAGVAIVVSGEPLIPKPRVPFKAGGASQGTSIAGAVTDAIIGDAELPGSWKTLQRKGCCFKFTATKSASRFVARWIPYIGVAFITYDAAGFAGCVCGCKGI